MVRNAAHSEPHRRSVPLSQLASSWWLWIAIVGLTVCLGLLGSRTGTRSAVPGAAHEASGMTAVDLLAAPRPALKEAARERPGVPFQRVEVEAAVRTPPPPPPPPLFDAAAPATQAPSAAEATPSGLLHTGSVDDVMRWAVVAAGAAANRSWDSPRFWRQRFRTSVPGGYHSPRCIARSVAVVAEERRQALGPLLATAEESGASAAAGVGGDRCLSIPRMSAERRLQMRAEVFAQLRLPFDDPAAASWLPADFRNPAKPEGAALAQARQTKRSTVRRAGMFLGIRLLAIMGREEFVKIMALAIKRMLVPFGGVAAHATVMAFWWQNATVRAAVHEFAGIPPELIDLHFWPKTVPAWDFTRLYRDVQDGYMHIKLDDDLCFISFDLDLTLAHAFFFPQEHQLATANSATSASTQECEVVSANVVNHHWLTSVHQQIGAINFLLDSLLQVDYHVKSSDYAFPALWARIHRDFLHTLRDGASASHAGSEHPLAKFDFGIHDFNCDGAKRRWSINAFLFPWSRAAAQQIPAGDEEYVARDFPYGREGRGRACALGKAVVVHFMFQHQGVWTVGMGTTEDGRIGRAEAAKCRLRRVYEAIALDMDGRERCCASTGCPLFDNRDEFDNTTSTRDSTGSLRCGAADDSGDDDGNGRSFSRLLRCTYPFPPGTNLASIAHFLAFSPEAKPRRPGKRLVRRPAQRIR